MTTAIGRVGGCGSGGGRVGGGGIARGGGGVEEIHLALPWLRLQRSLPTYHETNKLTEDDEDAVSS